MGADWEGEQGGGEGREYLGADALSRYDGGTEVEHDGGTTPGTGWNRARPARSSTVIATALMAVGAVAPPALQRRLLWLRRRPWAPSE